MKRLLQFEGSGNRIAELANQCRSSEHEKRSVFNQVLKTAANVKTYLMMMTANCSILPKNK